MFVSDVRHADHARVLFQGPLHILRRLRFKCDTRRVSDGLWKIFGMEERALVKKGAYLHETLLSELMVVQDEVTPHAVRRSGRTGSLWGLHRQPKTITSFRTSNLDRPRMLFER